MKLPRPLRKFPALPLRPRINNPLPRKHLRRLRVLFAFLDELVSTINSLLSAFFFPLLFLISPLLLLFSLVPEFLSFFFRLSSSLFSSVHNAYIFCNERLHD